MKRLFIAALALAAICGTSPRADAAQVVLCASARAQGNSSASQIGIPNLSQTYTADPQGCVVANGIADIAVLRSAGWSEPGKERSIVFTSGVATGTTSYLVGQIPPGAYLQQIIYANSTANAAGNISFGSTSGGADVTAAVACSANCVAASTLLKTVFSTSLPQQIFVTSSAWGSASLTVTIIYGWF
jgi:hypothetical protein